MWRVRCLWCCISTSHTKDLVNGHLHYPHDLDRPLNESAADKMRQYLTDYNNRPSHTIAFMPTIVSPSVSTQRICVPSIFTDSSGNWPFSCRGVQLVQSTFHVHRVAFSSQLKSKVGHILTKAAALRIMLNIDGSPIASRSHTHPSHTQNSRLLTSSLSLGVPGPRSTQCIRNA